MKNKLLMFFAIVFSFLISNIESKHCSRKSCEKKAHKKKSSCKKKLSCKKKKHNK